MLGYGNRFYLIKVVVLRYSILKSIFWKTDIYVLPFVLENYGMSVLRNFTVNTILDFVKTFVVNVWNKIHTSYIS